MAVCVEVSNEQLAALKAKAAAQGLKLQGSLHKLAEGPGSDRGENRREMPIRNEIGFERFETGGFRKP